MSSEKKLIEVHQEILTCQKCPLALGRKHAVPGEGPSSVDVMLIGEGPGHHENEQGRPFVGQAGMFLDELLSAADLKREEVFITNVVKCRPPGNRDPEPEELAACSIYLDEQIELLNPKIILTLGRFSMAKFIENGRISRIHGQSHYVKGRTIITMYHPAAALHQPALREIIIKDFARLKTLLALPQAFEVNQPDHSKSQSGNEEQDTLSSPEQLSLF